MWTRREWVVAKGKKKQKRRKKGSHVLLPRIKIFKYTSMGAGSPEEKYVLFVKRPLLDITVPVKWGGGGGE